MPRRSSGGRTAPRPVRNPPQPARSAPPPAPVQGGSALGGIGATIADGIAFGTGSAIAHRAVDSVLGPRTIQHEMVAPPAPAATAAPLSSSIGSDACNTHSKAFQDVLIFTEMAEIKTSCVRYPEGWELIEPTLQELIEQR
ncbi:unnamed protein product [Musa acuminata subsp. burmannicoides]